MASRETQPVQRKSADERKELLAHTVENEVARGSRVESQSDFRQCSCAVVGPISSSA